MCYHRRYPPAPKQDAVKAGCLFTALIELLSLVLLAPCCLLVLEILPHISALSWLDDMDAATQLRLIPMLAVSIVVYIVGMLPTLRMSAHWLTSEARCHEWTKP